MARRKYLRVSEVVKVCRVDVRFVARLEREQLIQPVLRRRRKVYPLEQVDRVRVAHILFHEMGVNLEGIEVALHMREQMIAAQREFDRILRSLAIAIKRR
ncbi:MAG TPA: chaperone modulator CbpM [Candidatus Binatia bacterium]|jgi:DNA-binding transcriptional MerR regulator|nr:chaperone modulator CbpM [Candidatus Binatia bacterium]